MEASVKPLRSVFRAIFLCYVSHFLLPVKGNMQAGTFIQRRLLQTLLAGQAPGFSLLRVQSDGERGGETKGM